MRRSEAKARGIVIRNVSRAGFGVKKWRKRLARVLVSPQSRRLCHYSLDDFAECCDLIQTDKGVDLRHRLPQLVGEALRHTATDDELLMGALVQTTALMSLKNGFDRFFLGRVDKGASIDHEHISFIRIG